MSFDSLHPFLPPPPHLWQPPICSLDPGAWGAVFGLGMCSWKCKVLMCMLVLLIYLSSIIHRTLGGWVFVCFHLAPCYNWSWLLCAPGVHLVHCFSRVALSSEVCVYLIPVMTTELASNSPPAMNIFTHSPLWICWEIWGTQTQERNCSFVGYVWTPYDQGVPGLSLNSCPNYIPPAVPLSSHMCCSTWHTVQHPNFFQSPCRGW